MKVLVIGSGGREHTLAWRLRCSPSVSAVCALPGNPGIAALGSCLPGKIDDLDGIVHAARGAGVDLVVVGPEVPLALGLADRLREAGIPTFGPGASGARLESSKVFSKELFRDEGIPTAAFEVFDDPDRADAYLRQVGAPIVVKADGLAAGKGALICETLEEALAGVDQLMRQRCFGAAGDRIVIEECMTGPELSVMAVTDGQQLVLLPISQDHKRALDGDQGLNTGGMGAYSPVPRFDQALLDQIVETCLQPTLDGLRKRGVDYRGVLYGGFMLTPDGVKTLEYNCRFGDPETQVLLPRLESDFGQLCWGAAQGDLSEVEVAWTERAAVCVVMASGGYPESYQTGHAIQGIDTAEQLEDVVVFHAGTKLDGGQLVTAGGRVLGVTALGDTISAAVEQAYRAVDRIGWTGCHSRRDIAYQALADES